MLNKVITLPKNGVRCQEPQQFKLELWDKNDGWIDVCGPGSKYAIDKAWNAATKNGTQYTKYEHGSYYQVSPYKAKCPQ